MNQIPQILMKEVKDIMATKTTITEQCESYIVSAAINTVMTSDAMRSFVFENKPISIATICKKLNIGMYNSKQLKRHTLGLIRYKNNIYDIAFDATKSKKQQRFAAACLIGSIILYQFTNCTTIKKKTYILELFALKLLVPIFDTNLHTVKEVSKRYNIPYHYARYLLQQNK